MKDLYNLTQSECIDLVKRNIVDCIYSSARIEGIAVTFPDTQQIYDGRSVANLTIDDINKVNNLKHAWQFIFNSIDYPLDTLYLRQLNQIINSGLMHDAGLIRTYDVNIGGTTWKPCIPDPQKLDADILSIMKIPCVTERAITLMLYIMRSQPFSDGNKRVAQLAANQILIQNGKGYLRLSPDDQNTFFKLLVDYYETNDKLSLSKYLFNTAILGKKNVRSYNQPPISEDMFIKKRIINNDLEP